MPRFWTKLAFRRCLIVNPFSDESVDLYMCVWHPFTWDMGHYPHNSRQHLATREALLLFNIFLFLMSWYKSWLYNKNEITTSGTGVRTTWICLFLPRLLIRRRGKRVLSDSNVSGTRQSNENHGNRGNKPFFHCTVTVRVSSLWLSSTIASQTLGWKVNVKRWPRTHGKKTTRADRQRGHWQECAHERIHWRGRDDHWSWMSKLNIFCGSATSAGYVYNLLYICYCFVTY